MIGDFGTVPENLFFFSVPLGPVSTVVSTLYQIVDYGNSEQHQIASL